MNTTGLEVCPRVFLSGVMGQEIISNFDFRSPNLKSKIVNRKSQTSLLLTAYCLLFTALYGCAISHGVYHKVEEGQTLWRIAKAYEVDIQDVAEFNDITDMTQIQEGQMLFIPGSWRVLKVEPYRPPGSGDTKIAPKKNAGKKRSLTSKHKPFSEESEGRIIVEKWRFSWPVKGAIISYFGVRNGKKHDGIDIAAATGTPVKAAHDGEVMFSNDSLRGYGYTIILKHKDGFFTVYAHNEVNLVKVGDTVKRGAIIAKLGDSGNASGPHLHFEVRKDRKPRNPLFFLP